MDLEDGDRQRKESGDRIAIEISDENEAHTAENLILKDQNQVFFFVTFTANSSFNFLFCALIRSMKTYKGTWIDKFSNRM